MTRYHINQCQPYELQSLYTRSAFQPIRTSRGVDGGGGEGIDARGGDTGGGGGAGEGGGEREGEKRLGGRRGEKKIFSGDGGGGGGSGRAISHPRARVGWGPTRRFRVADTWGRVMWGPRVGDRRVG